ncbi:hypothetical protein E1A91_A07G037900v1 [Gossypium mustelinum]|uniref:Uncharacterized protein n=1 Tax=Gossypium mustelinum TaxID=34275 RepID=A0A5D2YHF2_GOSMU|nr:hypothetical protein E1A91_A07G037900v1 [Gossypium mustelinum]
MLFFICALCGILNKLPWRSMIFVRDLSVNKLVKFQNLRRKEMHSISLRNFGTSWQIQNWASRG